MILTSILRDMFKRKQSVTAGTDTVTRALPKHSSPDPDRLSNFFAPGFWMTSDPAAVLASAKAVTEVVFAGHHFADNFLTWGRDMSMLEDLPFVKS
jgi:O-methyltransferase